LTSVVN
jgi:hypothetical protein